MYHPKCTPPSFFFSDDEDTDLRSLYLQSTVSILFRYRRAKSWTVKGTVGGRRASAVGEKRAMANARGSRWLAGQQFRLYSAERRAGALLINSN